MRSTCHINVRETFICIQKSNGSVIVLGNTRLGVFVSGIGELVDERLVARMTIESMGLDAVAFEKWGARPLSSEDTYLEELGSSDIYVGVFARKWSDATEKEFIRASELDMPRLVYVRRLYGKEEREQELVRFIEKLRHPLEGLKYELFSNSHELESMIVDDLANVLSSHFRQSRTALASVDREFSAMGEIGETLVKFEAELDRDTAKAGESIEVKVTFSATLSQGLLTAQIIHEESKIYLWVPCQETWNPYIDLGLLLGSYTDKTYQWDISIPPWMPEGSVQIIPGLYEDPKGLPERGRHSIRLKVLSLSLEEGEDPLVKQISSLYQKILNREPDTTGVANWYNAIKSKRTTFGRMVIDGFLKSVEFRFGKIHSLLGVASSEEETNASIKSIQDGESSLNQLIAQAHTVATENGDLPENTRELVRELFTRAMGRNPAEAETNQIVTEITPDVGAAVPYVVLRILNHPEYLSRELHKAIGDEYPDDDELASCKNMIENDDEGRFGLVEEFVVSKLNA